MTTVDKKGFNPDIVQKHPDQEHKERPDVDRGVLNVVAATIQRKESGTVSDAGELYFEKFDWSMVPQDAIFIVVDRDQYDNEGINNVDNIRFIKLSDSYVAAVLKDPTRPSRDLREEFLERKVVEYYNLKFSLPHQFHQFDDPLSDVENGPAANISFNYHGFEPKDENKWGIQVQVHEKTTGEEVEAFRNLYGSDSEPPKIKWFSPYGIGNLRGSTPDEVYKKYQVFKEIRKFDTGHDTMFETGPYMRIEQDKEANWLVSFERLDFDKDGKAHYKKYEVRGATEGQVLSEYKKMFESLKKSNIH